MPLYYFIYIKSFLVFFILTYHVVQFLQILSFDFSWGEDLYLCSKSHTPTEKGVAYLHFGGKTVIFAVRG